MNPNNEQWPEPGHHDVDPHDSVAVLALFSSIADETSRLLAGNDDWSMSGERATQYTIDVEIDRACRRDLYRAGLAVLSEESGITAPGGAVLDEAPSVLVVVDPLDGSTNASLGLPWCATALCLVVDGEPAVAHVANLRTGARYAAVAGSGATLDGRPVRVAEPVELANAVVAINARPPESFRPRQHRGMGATALDIASVSSSAQGGFDATIDFDQDRIGVWDYLASVLIVTEAGGVAADALGRELITCDHSARRRPVTATSRSLLDELLAVAN